MSDKQLPKVVKQEKLNLSGLELIVCHLDNGQRVIDADSLERFFEKLGFCDEEKPA